MRDPEPWVSWENVSLLTDLYELTMLQAYATERMQQEAIFDLFIRRLPSSRNFLLAAGLDDALTYLEKFRFRDDDISYLREQGQFSESFLEWLTQLRFTGDVYAVPEGTPVFANEPILEVVAPIAEAQIAETFLLNQIQLQTMLASKAARIVNAAAGRTVVDFALRRMHGTDAGLKGARAFFIAGVDATSNVLAGKMYDIPIAGTMAHSYIEAHDDELSAFRAFAASYPETTLLVDTYDTLEGVDRVVALASELGERFRIKAVRLDSGDLGELAKRTRQLLDEAGLASVQIFASGGLDEWRIRDLLADGAPIDGFGVGTAMGASADAPALDSAYKLCGYGGEGRMKLSPEKSNLPGRKQIFRVGERSDDMHDVIARHNEIIPGGRPLMVQVMKRGCRTREGRDILEACRRRAREEAAKLPARCLGLEPADPPYPVRLSETLEAYRDQVRNDLADQPQEA